ncbi:hypothetical protein [Pedococcus sp. 5OH_020]|uniref:hypothetical protein n=1 Tax=Pedococcus sp. 5OH_020 TaxID=2989814 RepID=UPI0022E9FD34|nr:hypothetical protein [Pedococcus sp. 5OH_020]
MGPTTDRVHRLSAAAVETRQAHAGGAAFPAVAGNAEGQDALLRTAAEVSPERRPPQRHGRTSP